MNPILATAELERVGKSLRRHADEIRSVAPSLAAKIEGLSRECEIKRAEIDRRIDDHNAHTIDAVRARQCPTTCNCAECSP